MSKHAYSIQFKNQVLDWISSNALNNAMLAAQHFCIQPKTVKNWVEQQDALRQSINDGGRLRLKKHTQSAFVIDQRAQAPMEKHQRKQRQSLTLEESLRRNLQQAAMLNQNKSFDSLSEPKSQIYKHEDVCILENLLDKVLAMI
ncbi:Conserved_hypothetical protein [Hexamita inflata]|uniref:Transposase n=2 Tax=Hexamita inflata TaxID=28002 RepID=A0AA86R1H8_9EUKA|nr:Conserved hypothetical protein [Hexamita inflata]CAI9969960.1 Conserved hypothetical protein [Hexamita inflata]